jgi:hypothetical protein
MMLLLTNNADLRCLHVMGRVSNRPSQKLVTIEGVQVLVEDDPEGRSISGCPMVGAVVKPCAVTLKVKEGYSSLLRIQGHRVCLDTVSGLTDGTPPGTVLYEVKSPGQSFVSETA